MKSSFLIKYITRPYVISTFLSVWLHTTECSQRRSRETMKCWETQSSTYAFKTGLLFMLALNGDFKENGKMGRVRGEIISRFASRVFTCTRGNCVSRRDVTTTWSRKTVSQERSYIRQLLLNLSGYTIYTIY